MVWLQVQLYYSRIGAIKGAMEQSCQWCNSALLDPADSNVHGTYTLLPLYSGGIDSIQSIGLLGQPSVQARPNLVLRPYFGFLHFILGFPRFNDYAFVFIFLYRCVL